MTSKGIQLKLLTFSWHFCCGRNENATRKQQGLETPCLLCALFSGSTPELRLNAFETSGEYVLNAPPKFTAAVSREKFPTVNISIRAQFDQSILVLDDLKSPFYLPRAKSEENIQHIVSVRVPELRTLETCILSPNLVRQDNLEIVTVSIDGID